VTAEGRPEDAAAGAPTPRLLRLDAALRVASCASTQDLCRRLAEEGAPEGSLVVAGEQTSGRGREGRSWHSPAGAGLWTSFLLRPRLDPASWPALTPLAALALSEALEALAGGAWRAAIKWPNDVFGRHGKLAGILAESRDRTAVIGIGLNLTPADADFPPEIRGQASSLRIEGFRPVPTAEAVLAAFDVAFARGYGRLEGGDVRFLREGLLERFLLRGAQVRIGLPGAEIAGIAVDLGPEGGLILETPAGRREYLCGEVLAWSRSG